MFDENYEGDLNYTTIEGPDGVERTYVEDVILEHEGKEFAVLIEVLDEANKDQEPIAMVARIEEEGDDVYYESPTDEETEAVIDLYEQLLAQEEAAEEEK
ncbi:MAG: DUF1292 domain-containing protein [Veillonella sp.]|nr:DUF1292 domain-containing protein [Veillonella sp.]